MSRRFSGTGPGSAPIAGLQETFLQPLGDRLPGVFRQHTFPTGTTHLAGPGRIMQQQTQTLLERFVVGNDETAHTRQHRLRRASGAAGQDGQARRRRLEENETQTLHLEPKPA